jgi:hypothetical protein
MTAILQPLDKNPALDLSQDFYELRRQGIGFVQKAGSDQWTDYNVHDPGITILEALSYAITDLGYRLAWDIADILMPETPTGNPAQPYPDQAFFTARKILTVNPVTSDDFRRLLIDLTKVRDAWIVCKDCACEVTYWAFCDLSGELVLQYGEPDKPPNPAKEVWTLGLYEALVELEDDAELGDLNDRMIVYNTVYHDSDGAHPVTMELRFPDIALVERDAWLAFLGNDAVFADSSKFRIALTTLGAAKDFNVLSEPPADQTHYIQQYWSGVFYLSFTITLTDSGETIDIKNAALRVFGDNAVRNALDATLWIALFEDQSATGFILLYRKKAKVTADAIKSAKEALQSHRNLDEDYCLISSVGIEDVAVCADVEVKPDADIERVQAEIWFRIEQYVSPPVPFRTLQELQDSGEAVEDIFDGPALGNGFITDGDLQAASLRAMLRGSDIINLLMDINGVIAVNQLRMTKYDSEGAAVMGAADPTWSPDGQPIYDPSKLSAAWLLAISPRHQPRFYLNQSRFLFYKNGLPFLPRMDEATDVLNQLRGEAERPKNPDAPNDLPIPAGLYRKPADYYPVQYSFPLAYGIGPAGLPASATPARQAQARDLKAYLMAFEQLIGNALEQLAHTADLFSLDPAIAQTYFVKAFDETIIKGYGDLVDSGKLDPDSIKAMIETIPAFEARRNLFLDHLMARFGEEFSEYALLLTNAVGDAVAQPRLIENKIAFLKRYPEISHDRAKAFDYADTPNAPSNYPGIKKRISLLLGYPDLTFSWTVGAPAGGDYPVAYVLADGNGKHWLEGSVTVQAADVSGAEEEAYCALTERMILSDAYAIAAGGGAFTLTLTDTGAAEIGHAPQAFATQDEAATARDALTAWSANDRMIVVEHLLLRPKFIGDALYPACCDEGCATCGCEDPYSFRLTFVMPGWTEQYTDDLDLRRYAERTIQQETPSHLLGKTCWVGNDGFVENPCDEVVDKLADLLVAEGQTAEGAAPTPDDACACANAIYKAFSDAFTAWYADKKFAFLQKDALAAEIGALFQGVAMFADGACATVFNAALWDEVRAMMASHFVDIAIHGWQFERFEWAWRRWLDANAAIDWTDERLVERVEGILAANVTTPSAKPSEICDCARGIVTNYGAQFFAWMKSNVVAGKTPGTLTDFDEPAVTLCAGMTFAAGTQGAIAALLKQRYAAYRAASYWLWVVVTFLDNLRNTYPGATLHDCDDSGDQNPVRLDNTALGNYPRRSTI